MPFIEKYLRVPPPIAIGGRHIKRYHVNMDQSLIPDDIERAAYAMVPSLLPEPDGTPPASFVVLHRGGDGAAYVNAYSWVWDNVVHVAAAVAAQPMVDCPDDDPTHFVPLGPAVGRLHLGAAGLRSRAVGMGAAHAGDRPARPRRLPGRLVARGPDRRRRRTLARP